MSGTFAITLAVLYFASNFACYRLGQLNILARYKDYAKRRRERELRWQEFEDFED
jgi:hypothetical protein